MATTLASNILQDLVSGRRWRLRELPLTTGVYALRDHCGEVRYIGMTASSFRERINHRHVVGSASRCHMFSHAYNTGRLSGETGKKLRAQFCRTYCSASVVTLPNTVGDTAYKQMLREVEQAVLAIAPAGMLLWRGRAFKPLPEPVDLVDELLGSASR